MKMRLAVALVGLAIGFALPTFAQEQNTVDPEVRQQIEALLVKADEAYNNTTRLLWQPGTRRMRFLWEVEVDQNRITVVRPSRKGLHSTWHHIPAKCHNPTS